MDVGIEEVHMQLRKLNWGIWATAALVAAVVLVFAAPCVAHADEEADVQPGVVKQGDDYYYINAKGNKKTGTFKVGKWTYFTKDNGALEARKKGSKYYYNNGVRMTSADTKDYIAYDAARKMVKKLTKKSDSKASKRLKCFKWLMKQPTVIHRKWSYSREAWPAVYAMDHFKKIGGDCQSYAGAFAYMAAYIGYKNTYACTDSKTAPGGGHSWAMIGGAVFDAMFANREFSTYYNSRHGTYEVNPTTRVKVPSFNPKHAGKSAQKAVKAKASGKSGLVKSNGALYYYAGGKKVKKRWMTLGSKTYYFGSDGKAVTGANKIKFAGEKAYYVFTAKGVLADGKKTRVVRVRGISYRVSKQGKAVPGKVKANGSWTCYLENGAQARGLCVYKGNLTWFDAKSGVYDAATTKSVRAAATADADATALLQIAGQGKTTVYPDSCLCLPDQTGSDIKHVYDFVSVQTFKDDASGAELFVSFQSLV